ncbi:hypothetical protein [Listeria monocytogenes]|nr:hypothetical protein [Listeria monocytogenes]
MQTADGELATEKMPSESEVLEEGNSKMTQAHQILGDSSSLLSQPQA